MPQEDAGVPIVCLPSIASEPQQSDPENPNPDAINPLLQNVKRSLPKVELTRLKVDVVTPKIRLDLNNLDPKTKQQSLESIVDKDLPKMIDFICTFYGAIPITAYI
uniref:Uncharacterized protein n=1 Tax=Romanomermis culicivorax TaxID=13658 RepID=A0A915I1V7_ROMCU